LAGLVTRLEGSSCGRSSAHPEIQRTTNDLAAVRGPQTDQDIARVYRTAIDLINQYAIESTYDTIQLANMRTLPDRQATFELMHRCLMTEPQEHLAFELEIVHFDGQFAETIVRTRMRNLLIKNSTPVSHNLRTFVL
jgi:hypothetical protein